MRVIRSRYSLQPLDRSYDKYAMQPKWWPWAYIPVLIICTFKANQEGGFWILAMVPVASIAFIDMRQRFGARKLRRVAVWILVAFFSAWLCLVAVSLAWSRFGVCLPPLHSVRLVGDGQDVTECVFLDL